MKRCLECQVPLIPSQEEHFCKVCRDRIVATSERDSQLRRATHRYIRIALYTLLISGVVLLAGYALDYTG